RSIRHRPARRGPGVTVSQSAAPLRSSYQLRRRGNILGWMRCGTPVDVPRGRHVRRAEVSAPADRGHRTRLQTCGQRRQNPAPPGNSGYAPQALDPSAHACHGFQGPRGPVDAAAARTWQFGTPGNAERAAHGEGPDRTGGSGAGGDRRCRGPRRTTLAVTVAGVHRVCDTGEPRAAPMVRRAKGGPVRACRDSVTVGLLYCQRNWSGLGDVCTYYRVAPDLRSVASRRSTM